MEDALAQVGEWLEDPARVTRAAYFVNASTLNLACDDARYRDILRGADVVYGDGTGVRWAARALHGVRLADNVNGTDFVPRFFDAFAGRSHRYFLLGGTEEMNERAAAFTRERFSGWELAGRHHGYLDAMSDLRLVERLDDVAPDVLLVGMGNPAQERWIASHRDRIRVPVCLAIGGLFAYWSGDLDRAPAWIRRIGFEWLHLLVRQPRKSGRYLLGNPLFLARVAARRLRGQVTSP